MTWEAEETTTRDAIPEWTDETAITEKRTLRQLALMIRAYRARAATLAESRDERAYADLLARTFGLLDTLETEISLALRR